MLGYAEEAVDRRTTRPFALIEAALKEAQASRADIQCLAIGLGPGSYAGIRIAIAIAQGWQLARGIKLLGISSAEVVAAQAGQHGTVFVGSEARAGELFVAKYENTTAHQLKLIEPFHSVRDFRETVFRMDWPPGFKGESGIALPPKANVLAMLAVERIDYVSGPQLEPIYLRQADFVKAPPAKFSAM